MVDIGVIVATRILQSSLEALSEAMVGRILVFMWSLEAFGWVPHFCGRCEQVPKAFVRSLMESQPWLPYRLPSYIFRQGVFRYSPHIPPRSIPIYP